MTTKPRVKPWWQLMPLEDFKAKIEKFEDYELEALSFEIIATATNIARQLKTTPTKQNTEWRGSALQVQLRLNERRALVLSYLAKKRKNALRASVKTALTFLRAGNCGEGLAVLESAIHDNGAAE